MGNEDGIVERYQTVYQAGTGEITEKKSRFIADVFPVSSKEQAEAELEKIKKQYWDARHHCWAYVIGTDQPLERFSDDGEPSGTAGKPILEVIRGQELYNVLVVVTRYFGGTLLGTGGLVRAYTGATIEGLAHSMIITKIKGVKLKIRTDYTGLGKIQYILGKASIPILDNIYGENVDILALVPAGEENRLRAEITEGTNGKSVIEKEGECWFAIVDGRVEIFAEQ